ncbi:hypothetical protein ACYSNR_11385 [Enterococcus sp. LJL128]|uniref:hypothetical protein n=1 Tax=Enterococcus sp. LJL51 TaxID=3416656 RepID=UPI003CF9AB10
MYFLSISSVGAAPAGYLDIDDTNTPKINIVTLNGTDQHGNVIELPGEYGTYFKLTDDVTYEVVGDDASKVIIPNETVNTKIHRFSKNTQTEQSVLIRNAAVYNGKPIDLKFVIDDISFSTNAPADHNPYFNFIAVGPEDKNNTSNLPGDATYFDNWGEFFLFFGSTHVSATGMSDDLYYVGDNVSYHYEFYDHETSQQIDFKGIWNYNNINGLKAVSIPHASMDDFSDFYVRSLTTLGIKMNRKADSDYNGYVELYGVGTAQNQDVSKLSQTFQGINLPMNMQRKAASGLTRLSTMGILYDQVPIMRIAPSVPIVFGESNDATHTEPDYLNLKYSIQQTISKNSVRNRSTTFQINTEVPSYYDIDLNKIKITEYGDSTNKDLASRFNISYNGGDRSKVIISAKNSTSEEFEGTVYEIHVEAVPNATFDFENNKDEYGYQSNGVDNGYMTNFEMAGVRTVAYYTFDNPVRPLSGKLESQIIEGQTKSRVRYNGVPYADPRDNISYPKDTDFSNFGEEDIRKNLVENIRLDTENELLDGPVQLSINQNKLPDTSVPGEVTVYVVLTSSQGVITEVPVKVMITDSQTLAAITVQFLKEDDSIVHNEIILSDKTVGETVNLQTIKEITTAIQNIIDDDYKLISRPSDEQSVLVNAGGTVVQYKFSGMLKLKSAPSVINFGIHERDINATAMRINNPEYDKDLIVRDTRAVRTRWTLTAALTSPMQSTDKKATLTDSIRYVYNGNEIVLNSGDQPIMEHTNPDDAPWNVSDTWEKTEKGDGLKLDVVPVEITQLGIYQGEILWKLSATP